MPNARELLNSYNDLLLSQFVYVQILIKVITNLIHKYLVEALRYLDIPAKIKYHRSLKYTLKIFETLSLR